MEKRVPTEDF